MAMYFHGGGGGASEIQSSHPINSDGFHTLYLLNHTNNTPTPNMLLQNPNPNDSPPLLDALNPHAPSSSSSSSAFLPLGSHDFSGFHAFAAAPPPPPRTLHYNLWPSSTSSINIDHHQPATASTSSAGGGVGDMSPHMSFRRPSQQGLSLSLSSQQQTAYRPSPSSLSGELDAAAMSGGGDVVSFVLGSKYLKAAQEVLDEVVNVGKGIIQKSEYSIEGGKIGTKANRESTSGGNRDGSSSVGGGENSGNNNNNNGKQEAEVALTTAQRQELQMKKSKLISMLDEVEQRYRQYEQEMRIVISSFEQAAGYGGAKTYTSLALKTISKQFRCLKDAIASQVRATSKSLGEEECWLGYKVEGSRLKYVDHHLRQHRALQQIGMMQPNAWRPQRGLPERAVSILRAWLFEHFLHPYPKDSDKVMLAKQTGLTRSQVSNWFINARVRLWKPMVEEMYMEEMKDDQDGSHRENSSAGKEVAGPSTNNNIKEPSQLPQDHPSGGSGGGAGFIHNIHHHHHHHDMQITSPKKARTSSTTSEMMMMHNTPSSILSSDANTNHHGFSMEDIGRFNNVVVDHHQLPPTRFHHQHANNNAVSLTLGLPHTPDNNISSLSHGFLSSHNINLGSDHHDATSEFCGINTSHSSATSNYESNNIDIQNRKRFAAQLLPDFVS